MIQPPLIGEHRCQLSMEDIGGNMPQDAHIEKRQRGTPQGHPIETADSHRLPAESLVRLYEIKT